ncbi:TIGR01621 family pseudouridine synthase [Catenovulum sediminis]|uniref:TIGR01621 family pseudouridine synthase n=1 Tax=Catenovulum sediminis TaxID=1740262 RepID=UPI00117ECE88|nr:TIGR01621 family pseudouridine synthase [Catenovulum sediminis]
MPHQLIYTHPDFYVFNKTQGVDFHDDNGVAGFFSQIKHSYPSEKLYPVHRLDKETSGLIIVARNLAAEQYIQQLFQASKIEKYYWAIAGNKPKQKQGRICGDMKKSRNKGWMLAKSTDNPAKTYFYSFGLGNGYRHYLLKPYTGKTHQLRVAMKSIGSAILGDDIYKGQSADRLYLHAQALRIHYQQQIIEVQLNPDHPLFKIANATDENKKWINAPWSLNWPKL